MVKTRRNKKKKVHNYAEGYYNLEDDDWDDEDWEDEEQRDSDEEYRLWTCALMFQSPVDFDS